MLCDAISHGIIVSTCTYISLSIIKQIDRWVV